MASLSQAQEPIRLIVPYAPGGPLDITSRALAERVRDSLGVVIIDNKAGAGGNIGADAIAKANPDGMTIGLAATATHAVNPWLYTKMPYDAGKDFAGITQMVRVPNVLVMNAAKAEQLKIHSVADLVAYAKSHPGKLNYGSGGNGSAGHLAGEMLKQKAGILRCTCPTVVPTLHSWLCCRARSISTSTICRSRSQHQERQAGGPGGDIAQCDAPATQCATAVQDLSRLRD